MYDIELALDSLANIESASCYSAGCSADARTIRGKLI